MVLSKIVSFYVRMNLLFVDERKELVMSIVLLVAFLVVGVSFVALFSKESKASVGQFVKHLLGMSALLVPAVVLLSACQSLG